MRLTRLRSPNSTPLIVRYGSCHVTTAPSLLNRTELVPLWWPFTLLPRAEAAQLPLPQKENCRLGRQAYYAVRMAFGMPPRHSAAALDGGRSL